MGKNSMIDTDFIEDDEDQFSVRDEFSEREPFENLELDDKPKAKAKEDELEIEVVTDTPDKDRGKWVADDERDGEPDIPSDDELKSYSKDIQKRISKMTARLHAERRAKEDLARQLDEAAKFTQGLVTQKNQLSELVENGEKVLLTEHKGRLESVLNAAKVAYREAHEAGDVNGMIAAQENIAKTAAAIDRLSVHRPAPMPRTDVKQVEQVFRPQQQQPQVDERTQHWQEKNTWFGRDTVMTAFAMGVHADLVQAKGIQPTDPRYWKELDSEMHKRFPEKFQSARPRRSETIVAPATRGGSGEARKVTLTESQVKLARRLGLTTEQYARQVMKEQHDRKDS